MFRTWPLEALLVSSCPNTNSEVQAVIARHSNNRVNLLLIEFLRMPQAAGNSACFAGDRLLNLQGKLPVQAKISQSGQRHG